MRMITFCGITSASLGLHVDAQTVSGIPAANWVLVNNVAGRNGFVTTGLGSATDGTVKAKVFAGDLAQLNAMKGWLYPGRRGRLILSDDAAHAYDAVLMDAVQVDNYTAYTYEVQAVWAVQPYRIRIPEAEAVTYTVSGSQITNPGTMAARPLILVAGSGDIALAVGGHSIDIEGLDTSILIDTDAFTASSADMTVNKMNSVTGDVGELTLPVGPSMISWSGDGTVSSVTVTPRWRDW